MTTIHEFDLMEISGDAPIPVQLRHIEDATSFIYKDVLFLARGQLTDWGYPCQRAGDGVTLFFHPRTEVYQR